MSPVFSVCSIVSVLWMQYTLIFVSISNAIVAAFLSPEFFKENINMDLSHVSKAYHDVLFLSYFELRLSGEISMHFEQVIILVK